jgi:hypothetical protein
VAVGLVDGRTVGNPVPVDVTVRVGDVVRISVSPGSRVSGFDYFSGTAESATSGVLNRLCQNVGSTAFADFLARRTGSVEIVAEPRPCACAMVPFSTKVTVLN